MRKYLLPGLMPLALFFNNCSSNDDHITSEPTEKKLLLSKITTVYYDNPSAPQTTVSTLEYNNQGELIKTISEGTTSQFEYNNGKPVRINYYKADQTLEYYATFTYNGDQLIASNAIYTNPNSNRKVTYTYNSNGQLASDTLCQTEDCSHPSVTSYTYNGNNVSVETSANEGIYSSSNKIEFSYDDKLNPFTNTNKYFRILMGRAYVLSKNNYTQEKISYKYNNQPWTEYQNTTYTIQYNSFGFPVEVIGKDANGKYAVKYNYEYTFN
ncbi:hypothetical protein [Chryseobacterium sp. CT-SW4]|uniref:hypothetical protein n=1 Tax=Chryseobacterium sp. SW-1 TaxID=3157343 RepID=UPI003B02B5B7